jgi:hypothetical protein
MQQHFDSRITCFAKMLLSKTSNTPITVQYKKSVYKKWRHTIAVCQNLSINATIYLTHYTHPQKLCKDKIFITDVLNTKQNRVYDKELSLIVKQDDPEGI